MAPRSFGGRLLASVHNVSTIVCYDLCGALAYGGMLLRENDMHNAAVYKLLFNLLPPCVVLALHSSAIVMIETQIQTESEKDIAHAILGCSSYLI